MQDTWPSHSLSRHLPLTAHLLLMACLLLGMEPLVWLHAGSRTGWIGKVIKHIVHNLAKPLVPMTYQNCIWHQGAKALADFAQSRQKVNAWIPNMDATDSISLGICMMICMGICMAVCMVRCRCMLDAGL